MQVKSEDSKSIVLHQEQLYNQFITPNQLSQWMEVTEKYTISPIWCLCVKSYMDYNLSIGKLLRG